MTAAATPTAGITAPWELDRASWDELSSLLAELESRLEAKEATIRRLAAAGYADAGPVAPAVDVVSRTSGRRRGNGAPGRAAQASVVIP